MSHVHADVDGPVRTVLGKLAGVKRTTDGWIARCPAHDDRTPSLSVGVGDDGRALLHCFAGCTTDAICGAIGLEPRDLFAGNGAGNGAGMSTRFATAEMALASLRARHGAPAGVWRYAAANGREVGITVRFDAPGHEGGKVVLPISLRAGAWVMRAMATPRPLYRLSELANTERIIVCEGEKAADAAFALGYVVTTSAGGCKAAGKTDWSPLAGREVVLIPDNDDPGRAYIESVKERLFALNPAPTIRVVELPDLPESGDIVEFIMAHGGDVEATRAALDALIEGAVPIEPPAAVDLSALAVLAPATPPPTQDADDADFWPEPLPVPVPLPRVLPFDPNLLPAVFHPWITDIANRMQCPPDFPAVGAMIAAAGVIGRKIGIHPKRFDDWLVIPNLWGVLIGRPSIMKSPPLREVMRPVKQLVRAADREYAEEMQAHRQQTQELTLRQKALETKVKQAIKKSGGDAPEEMKALQAITGDLEATPPRRKRYVINDATVQALADILAVNPNGVTLVRDEVIGFLKSLDMETQQAARAFFLEAWDGNGSFESDRIGRGNTRVEAVCLSIVGTCQPGPLGEYLSQAVRGGTGDDGLMQRFQLAVWPDDTGPWVNVDEYPDSDARQAASEVFQRLDTLTPEAVGIEVNPLDTEDVPALRFDDAAYERFIAWMHERENRLRSGTEAPVMESHLTKFRSLIPSIALICHLVDGGTGPVPLTALERAIGWGAYLESHARRVYSQGLDAGIPAARALAEKILEQKVTSGFVLRDVYRARWARLAGKAEARAAVDLLVELDWLKPETKNTGGAPKTIYHLNPRVLAEGFEPLKRE